MELSIKQFLIICPMCFLAGFIDSIGGGGGLLSLPAFLLAGLPAHMAVGTNKIQAFLNTGMSSARLAKKGYFVPLLILPSILGAVIGSALGAHLNLLVDEALFEKIMVFTLPVIAVIVFYGKIFSAQEGKIPELNLKTVLSVLLSSFLIAIYDGFYGPGAGTFLIIAFTALCHFDIRYANCHAKITNTAMSVGSMTVYLLNGQCIIPLGLAAGVSAMAGSYIGSGLVIRNGAKIVRPVILFVILFLMVKILVGF